MTNNSAVDYPISITFSRFPTLDIRSTTNVQVQGIKS